MSDPARILISGYYGSGNLGDEAILAALVAAIRRLHTAVEITVLSANPAQTEAAYGVEAIGRFDFGEIRRRTKRAQLLIVGGGGLLQDTTSWRSPLYYLWVMWQAKRQGVPTAALFQGMGPLRRRWLRHLAAKIYRHLDLVVVRDANSAQILADIGLNTASIQIASDAAWLLEPDAACDSEALLQNEGIEVKSPLVGVFLRPQPNFPPAESGDLWEATAQALEGFHREYGGTPLFIPMQRPSDVQAAQEVARRLEGKAAILHGEYTPAQMLALIGKTDIVVGMRLHGLIFAASMAKPAVGIGYDPKVEAFLAQMGLCEPMPADKPDAQELQQKLNTTWLRKAELGEKLRILAEEKRAKTKEALQNCMALLKN